MDILQIGDIVRISDSVAEDPLEDWSFVIYNRHVNTSKRITNAGQFGCVTGLIRIGLTDDIYVFVVPCQKDFDFLQDRHALRHVGRHCRSAPSRILLHLHTQTQCRTIGSRHFTRSG